MNFSECSSVISGRGGGLGGATARRLHALGFGVVLFDPDLAKATELAQELGERAVAMQEDQNCDEDVTAAIHAAKDLGTFSVVVNAAGVQIQAPYVTTPDGIPHDMETFRRLIDNHLTGPFNVSRLSAAAFSQNAPDQDGQRGVIVNTACCPRQPNEAGRIQHSKSWNCRHDASYG